MEVDVLPLIGVRREGAGVRATVRIKRRRRDVWRFWGEDFDVRGRGWWRDSGGARGRVRTN